MGKFEKGVLGHFDGKVGTVVGSTWRGVDYMKSKPRKSKKPPTKKQLEQQAKFALVTRFIRPLNKLLSGSFNDPTKDMTGLNRALAYNIKKAIEGNYPAFALAYNKVLVSEGILHNVYTPVATATGNGILQFNWTANSGANANDDDTCVGVVYCPEMNQAVYTVLTGARRDEKTDELSALIFTGKTVQTWIFFVSANGTEISSSLYTGQLVVS